METIVLLVSNFAAVAAFMAAGWVISLIRKNAAIADSLWGLGFVLVAWLTFFQTDGFFWRKVILVLPATVWGMRLFFHITIRNLGKGEDPRYAAWRKQYGERFWLVSFYKVFLAQALFLWVIAIGLQYGQISETPAYLTWLDAAGLLVWLTGFTMETMADYQLKAFLADPANKGRIMDRGLWRYSRHPNYFGESLVWWGIFLIVLSTPMGFLTIVSPLVITYTLLRLTGVTLMEQTEFSDHPEYQSYIRRTSAFVPWFPKTR